LRPQDRGQGWTYTLSTLARARCSASDAADQVQVNEGAYESLSFMSGLCQQPEKREPSL